MTISLSRRAADGGRDSLEPEGLESGPDGLTGRVLVGDEPYLFFLLLSLLDDLMFLLIFLAQKPLTRIMLAFDPFGVGQPFEWEI